MRASCGNISHNLNNNQNGLDGIPCEILGYCITTRTQICLSCLATTILRLLVYLVVTTVDVSVTVQHFRDDNQLYGSLTLALWYLPAVACFCSIVTSPWQWPETPSTGDSDGCNWESGKFLGKQLFNLLLFPFSAVYRLSYTIFWSIEALFHEENTYERQYAVERVTEPSTVELYYFLQAFLQAAPQVILQLYILLREDTFRNYETSSVQIVSVVFSLITIAIIVASYQRFESQKCVGRNYPWIPIQEVKRRRRRFAKSKSILEEVKPKPTTSYVEMPETEYVMNRFYSMNEDNSTDARPQTSYSAKKSLHLGNFNFNYHIKLSDENLHKSFDFMDANNSKEDTPLNIPMRIESSDQKELPTFSDGAKISISRYSYSRMDKIYNSDSGPSFEASTSPPEILNTVRSKSPDQNNLQDTEHRNTSIRRYSYSQIEELDVNLVSHPDNSPKIEAPAPPQSPEQNDLQDTEQRSTSIRRYSYSQIEELDVNLASHPDSSPTIEAPAPPQSSTQRGSESPEQNDLQDTEQRSTSIRRYSYSYSRIEELDGNLASHPDNSPTIEAPLPPQSPTQRGTFQFYPINIKMEVANRLSTFKDMILLDAELYIKDNIPRLPKSIFEHDKNSTDKKESTDTVDMFYMPTRKKLVEGIEQDDIIGKTIAFTSWVLFIFTRMIALSVFSVFYPKECAYLCLIHYLAMLILLLYETKCHEKIERIYFYFFLAYIYIFCIIEFKIKFRKPRYMYGGYVLFILLQNLTITLIWYFTAEFESWWFHYLFMVMALSFSYSIMCMLLYFFMLKPRDKILFENE